MIDWSLVSEGMPDKQRGDLMRQGAQLLEGFLDKHPEAEGEITELIGSRVVGPVETGTWNALLETMALYLGEDLGKFVLWAASAEWETPPAYEIERYASPEVAGVIRRLAGRYGIEIRNAVTISGEVPDNWRTLHREIYYDVLSERYHILLRIEKFNGDAPLIEGNAEAFLGLTRGLMNTLRQINAPGAFDPRAIAEFLAEADEFIAPLRSQLEAGSEASAVPTDREHATAGSKG
jgi:hypothetical protein